jgi:hypothetical protein
MPNRYQSRLSLRSLVDGLWAYKKQHPNTVVAAVEGWYNNCYTKEKSQIPPTNNKTFYYRSENKISEIYHSLLDGSKKENKTNVPES